MNFKKILAMIWQLPQTWLGAILLIIFGYVETLDYKGKMVYVSERFKGGISLGEVIIVHKEMNMRVVAHEYGHSIQSMYFGPLYLLVIGLPSLFFNILTRVGILKRETYYDRYPENWANKLGGV